MLKARGQRPRIRALPNGALQLVLEHPTLAVVRTATLTPEEVQLLQRTPAGAWALGTEPDVLPAEAAKRG